MSSTDFDFPADLSPFPASTQDILRMAHALGWNLRWQGSNKHVVHLRSPIEADVMVTVPSTNLNEDRSKSTVRRIARYSDPDTLADYIDSQSTVRKSTVRVALGLGPAPAKPRPTPPAAPVPAPPTTAVATAMREAEVRAAAADKAIATYDEEVSRGRDAPVVPAAEGEPSRTLVTAKPWMVRRGGQDGKGGVMYESPVVTERIWSDGYVDYRCKSCDYVNENPRSVSSHAATKHSKGGKQPQPAGRKVTHYEASGFHRTQSAARRLATEMLHVLDSIEDWKSLDPTDLAKRLAEGVYEQRPDREPVAELTPEQIIARIVGLVDAGRLADMHQQVEAAAAALRQGQETWQRAEREREEAVAEARRLREERQALRDLLAEDRSDAS